MRLQSSPKGQEGRREGENGLKQQVKGSFTNQMRGENEKGQTGWMIVS